MNRYSRQVSCVCEQIESEWKKKRAQRDVYKMKTNKPLNKLVTYDDIVRGGEGLYVPSEEEKRREEQKRVTAKNLTRVGKIDLGMPYRFYILIL